MRRKEASFRFPIKGGKLYLYGHNPLIRAGYRGAIGLKTGYTDEAGRCFVGVARRDGRTLGVVLLNSSNPLKHATALLDQGFRAEGPRVRHDPRGAIAQLEERRFATRRSPVRTRLAPLPRGVDVCWTPRPSR